MITFSRNLGLMAAASALLWGGVAQAAVVDAAWTNTSQIQSAANTGPLFTSITDLAAVNVHYGSRPAGGTLNGIGFLDVAIAPSSPPPGSGNIGTGVTSGNFAAGVTLDYDFSGAGAIRELNNANVTGTDATVANNIAYDNRYFGVPASSEHTMTFHGLGADQALYVQLIGGQHGWNDNTTVYANGASQGVWNSNKTNRTAGLFGFMTTATSGGDLTVELQTNRYGGMAAAIVSAATPATLAVPVIDGLNLWLDASNIDGAGNTTLTNGDPVDTWTDLASGNDMSKGASTAPVYVASASNGEPAVRFDVSTDRLTGSGTHTWQTVFVVNRVDRDPSNLAGIIGRNGGDFGIRRNGTTGWRGIGGNTNSGDRRSRPAGADRFHSPPQAVIRLAHLETHQAPSVRPVGLFLW